MGEIEVITDPKAARAMALFSLRAVRLGELAQRARWRGMAPRDAVIVCIEVDSSWRPLVDHLMPERDWQRFRAQGAAPIAQGSVIRAHLIELMEHDIPDIVPALRRSLPDGQYHAVVCVDGGASVFPLSPREEAS